MRIAIISPLMESVPPKFYGGTERIVSYLTEELVHQGHDVTLFASGDSVTCADLRPMTERSLRLDPNCRDPFAHYAVMLDEVTRAADQFDVLHFNIDYLHFPLARHLGLRTVTTLHGRQDLPDLAPLYRHFADMPVVSISHAQRQPIPWANWVATVHHGLPTKLYRPVPGPGDYLAFLGRISPEKRPDRAIRIARRAGLPLKIAAKVEKGVDEIYFQECIRPLLQEPGVDFIGEIGEAEKNDFLGGAVALLFPIDWPEPFGIVMIEAMACGTPVIAFPCGSVPEVVRDGVNGYIVADEDEAVAAVDRCRSLDRRACRRDFEKRYSAERMARDYVTVYGRLMADSLPAVEA
ncbi:MAG TPA: glycosyltransferase family 4 protein [Rhodocyclaceae bacterium]|nr:glycosyltransferase family 4 protein [Rhodocyclaceae bacterium]